MAAIQDLPAELLYRILELVEIFNREDLLRTSLVCRDWTVSSQALLHRFVHCTTIDGSRSITQHLAHVRCARVDSLLLDMNDSAIRKPASDLLTAPEGLRSLTLIGRRAKYDVAALLSPIVMASLEALSINLRLQGSLSLPRYIPLRALELDSSDLPPPSVLDPILRLAGDLQSLTLWVADSTPLPQTLLDIAPRLTRLELVEVDGEPSRSPPSCMALLAACTSLRSLEVDYWSLEIIVEMLQACPSQLVMLATIDIEGGASDVRSHRPLQDALKFSCLAKLKRWRMRWADDKERADEIEWRQECKARGIEVRGVERYFTD